MIKVNNGITNLRNWKVTNFRVMGNKSSQSETERHGGSSRSSDGDSENLGIKEGNFKDHNRVSLVKLFEKLTLTEGKGHDVSCELSRTTFENAFKGPFRLFGKLLYRYMMEVGGAGDEKITRDQFIKAGREIVNWDQKELVNYYFHFFAGGRDVLGSGGAVARDVLESGGAVARDVLESGGDVARDVLESGGAVARDVLESGGAEARDVLKSGGAESRDVLESGGAEARDVLESGGAEGRDVLKSGDAKIMFEVSFVLTLSASRILCQEDELDARMIDAMVAGLFGTKTEISVVDFSKWQKKSCPHLFDSVHSWVLQVLAGSTLPQEMEMEQVEQLDDIISTGGCISMASLWILSIALPPVYTPPPPGTASASDAASSLPSSSAAGKEPMKISPMLKRMERLPQLQSWSLLYSSCHHGLSINRFKHHVSSYNAPSIMIIAFEGGHLYCLAVDRSWLEGVSKFGGVNCMLIQLLPAFQVVQAGEKMVRWNESARGIPKGISIGCDGKAEVLRLSPEFDSVLHYGAPYKIHSLELCLYPTVVEGLMCANDAKSYADGRVATGREGKVWGCGTDSTLQSQKSQKDWESKAVEREKSRKLRPEAYGEDPQNNPDKQLLQWGGVNVGNHSYR